MTIRYATVAGDRETVAAYLPGNYVVVGTDGDNTIVAGEDFAGWTLDDYVLPRLASGLHFGRELTEIPEWLHTIADAKVRESL